MNLYSGFKSILIEADCGKGRSERALKKIMFSLCTKIGHKLVDGLHSLEKKSSYKCRISIDWKNRRSTTGSFFDSFLSFSGWCGVRGSNRVTV